MAESSSLVVKTADGSFERPDGRVLLFSHERFERDLVRGDCCFICGVSPEGEVPFNNEHILPRWILRKFDLFQQSIELPNRTGYTYGQYTLPCCAPCNSLMGEVFETPIRALVEGGLNQVNRYLEKNGGHLFFCWLALIFLKTHLKDWRLPLQRDRRSGDMRKLGAAYDPVTLQHVHVLARSFYTQSVIEKEAMGSLFVLPAERADHLFRPFDFADFYGPKSILLRLGDLCFVAVLSDSCGAFSLYLDYLRRIEAPLLPVQLREVLGDMSCIAENLKEQARFHSRFEGAQHIIGGEHPAVVELRRPLDPPRGEYIYASVKNHLPLMPGGDDIGELVRQGRYTFLFDADGRQLRRGTVPDSGRK